jgi:hypothetical protein
MSLGTFADSWTPRCSLPRRDHGIQARSELTACAVLSRVVLGGAHLAGISNRRIKQIERGIATATARALASALGCPVNDLVEVVDGEGDA